MQKSSGPDAFGIVITVLVITVFAVSLFSCAAPPTQITDSPIAYLPPATITAQPELSYPAPIQALTPTPTPTPTRAPIYEELISEFTLPPIGDSPAATLRLVLSEPAHLSDNLQDLLGPEIFEKQVEPPSATHVPLPPLPSVEHGDEGWTEAKPCDPSWDKITYRTDEGLIINGIIDGSVFNGWRYDHAQSIYRDCGGYDEPPDITRWQPIVASDGTEENTDLLRYEDDILVYMGSQAVYENQLIFAARTTEHISYGYSACHVWRTDGPPESLEPILGGQCANHRGGPTYHLAASKERLFIGYADNFGNKSLFQSDGTKEGTEQVVEFSYTWYNLREMIVADGRLYLLMDQRLLAYDIIVE